MTDDFIPDLYDDQVDPARASLTWWRSRRVAARPPVPPPVRAVDLRTDDPIFPHGPVRRVGVRHGGDL